MSVIQNGEALLGSLRCGPYDPCGRLTRPRARAHSIVPEDAHMPLT